MARPWPGRSPTAPLRAARPECLPAPPASARSCCCTGRAVPRRTPRTATSGVSSAERLEARAHAVAESAVLVARLLQRELVGRLCFRALVLRNQNIALECGVLRVVGRRVRRVGE